jgi:hypothetical protein
MGCLRSGHSVTTWFASVGPDLFVPTSMILGPKEPSERSWVSHVREDPRVRIRLGDLVYERVAKKVDGDAEFASARAALEAKFAIKPEDRDPERTIWIYRLESRAN